MGGGWVLAGAGVACLPYRLAPLIDKGDGERSGTNVSGEARAWWELLDAISCGMRAFG